jgi:hypothetical protein
MSLGRKALDLARESGLARVQLQSPEEIWIFHFCERVDVKPARSS